MQNQFTLYAQIIVIVIIIILLIIFMPDRKEKVKSEENIKNIIKRIDKKKNFNDFIIDLENKEIKRINKNENILDVGPNKKLIKFYRFDSISVHPEDDLKKAIDLMIKFDIENICVVSKRNPRKLIGVINKEDIMGFLRVKSSIKSSFYNVN